MKKNHILSLLPVSTCLLLLFASPVRAQGDDMETEASNNGAAQAQPNIQKPRPLPEIPDQFKHPGLLYSSDELEFVKAKIQAGEQPWKSAFDQMKATPWAAVTYQPHAQEVISSGFGGKGAKEGGAGNASADAIAAHTQALMWVYTGDERHAQNCAKILNAWSILKRNEGGNWYLQASWITPHLTNAAELLRATYPKWEEKEITAFSQMLDSTLLPIFHNRKAYGNRLFSVSYAMMAIGVFNNDRAAFAEGLHRWVSYVPCWIYLEEDGPVPFQPNYLETGPSNDELARLYTSTGKNPQESWIFREEEIQARMKEQKLGDDSSMFKQINMRTLWYRAPKEAYVDGLAAETYRDLGHCDLALGGLGSAAEVAWHQGIDLYGMEEKRLVAFLELHSALRIDEVIPPAFYRVRGTPVNPTFEIVYNHYVNRKGKDLPKTKAFIEKALRPCLKVEPNGPPGWSWVEVPLGVRGENVAYPAVCNMAWEVLTHAGTGSAQK